MSQTAKKWIKNDAIDGTKIKLNNEEYLRSVNGAGGGTAYIGKVTNIDTWEFGIEPNWGTYPTTGTSLVNKDYVHDVIAGLRDLKDACRVASTVNQTAFSGLGATLIIDGITLVNGNRVLFKNQTVKSENGIYVVSGVGVDIAFTRSEDADAEAEITQGLAVDVVEGTANGRTRWLLTTADPITVGTTDLTFVEVPNPSTLVQFKEETFILSQTDIDNGSINLQNNAEIDSIMLRPDDGPLQRSGGVDFDPSSIGGAYTNITFAGDLAALLTLGDVLIVNYAHYS